MLVTSARTYAALELVHKDGLKRRLHLLFVRKRGQQREMTLRVHAYIG